jgi:hypothetical protein
MQSDVLKRSVVKLIRETKRERFVSLFVGKKENCFPRIKREKHFPAIKVSFSFDQNLIFFD